MKIKILDKEIRIFIPDEVGRSWKFRFLILTIEARTYNKTKVYVQMDWDKPIIIKFIDKKWN